MPPPAAPPSGRTARISLVTHRAKQMPAARSSTGEQKALLLGLVLAHAELVAERRGEPPILLLDEVAAHLDPERRAALFEPPRRARPGVDDGDRGGAVRRHRRGLPLPRRGRRDRQDLDFLPLLSILHCSTRRFLQAA